MTQTRFLKTKTFFKRKDMRARVKIEYIRSLMAHLNVLALYSTFKFANFRGYDRARHAGKKWRGEIDHPWERG